MNRPDAPDHVATTTAPTTTAPITTAPTTTAPTTADASARAAAAPIDERPAVTLTLLSIQHALIHAQTALMPLVFIKIIGQFGIGVDSIGLLVAVGNIVSGLIQLAFGGLTRIFSRRALLGSGGLIFGSGMTLLAATSSWMPFAIVQIAARLGGTPQHTVGNALLAEQYRPERRSFAISFHIALGNLGTVAVPLVGGWLIARSGWQPAVLALGLPAIAVGLAILFLVRESGADRAAALGHGGTLAGFRSLAGERELLWIYLASSVAAAGRGLGVVSTFVPLYLSLELHLSDATVAQMYTLLLVGSVPGPIVAGWLAPRLGHRPILVTTYLAGAAALALLVVAGPDQPLIWLALGLMSAFVFVESSLLQALLAERARPAIRDIAFSGYFTLMFVVGAVWAGGLGALIGTLGNARGFPVAFGVMAVSYVASSIVVLRIRDSRLHRRRGDEPTEGELLPQIDPEM